jgi:hypothetical protein
MGKNTEIYTHAEVDALRADVKRLSSLKQKLKKDIQILVLERESLRDELPSSPFIRGDSLWTLLYKNSKPIVIRGMTKAKESARHTYLGTLVIIKGLFTTYDQPEEPLFSISDILQKLTPKTVLPKTKAISFSINSPVARPTLQAPNFQETSSRERIDKLLNTAFEELMKQTQSRSASTRRSYSAN